MKKLEIHFSKSGKMDESGRSELKESILAQLAEKSGGKVQQIDDKWMNMLTERNSIEIAAIVPPSKKTDWIGVSIYCDDKGKAKRLPVNQRASEILGICGKPMQVLGDAFFARQQDDGRELYKRMDFTIADLDSGAEWIKSAQAYHKKAASNLEESKKFVESMTKGNKTEENRKDMQTKKDVKKIVSADSASQYKISLEQWVKKKLQRYDTEPDFQSSRDKKYGSKKNFERYLMQKAQQKLRTETGLTDPITV